VHAVTDLGDVLSVLQAYLAPHACGDRQLHDTPGTVESVHNMPLRYSPSLQAAEQAHQENRKALVVQSIVFQQEQQDQTRAPEPSGFPDAASWMSVWQPLLSRITGLVSWFCTWFKDTILISLFKRSIRRVAPLGFDSLQTLRSSVVCRQVQYHGCTSCSGE
jgi:hypothetical protein